MRGDGKTDWDEIIDAWLKEHDKTPAKDRAYLTNRQMRKREKREIAISKLPKKMAEAIQHQLYSSASDSEQ
jgi:hypothetical protein